MRVEEQAIHSPRVRLAPPVHVFKSRDFGKMTIVLGTKVIKMCLVLYFSIIDPGYADSDAGQASKVANFTPEVGGLCCVVL